MSKFKSFFRFLAGISILVSFQNCGAGFNAKSGMRSPSALFNGDTFTSLNDDESPAAFYQTKSKTIGSARTTKTISWNLASEAQSGFSTTSVQAQISITSIMPPDGTAETYYISDLVVTAATRPIRVQGIHIWINGVKYEEGTTFKGINQAVAPSETAKLSTSIMLYQPTEGPAIGDTIAISFDTLWPDDEPLPNNAGSNPVSGLALYNTNCAGCHGAISSSTKKGRSFLNIKNAIYTVLPMTVLQGKVSDTEIQAIANELAK
ncbi:MAG: cytochrome c [Bdellovibrionota bacterium]